MHLRSFVELVKYSHLFLSCVLSLPPGLLNGLSRSPPACLMDWLRIDGVFFYDYHSAHSEPFIGASWMALMYFTSLSFSPFCPHSHSEVHFLCLSILFLFALFLFLYLATGLQPVASGFLVCVCVCVYARIDHYM